jgi:signal transduction histidine kinase
LHDGLGQNLLVIKHWASMAKRRLEPDSSASDLSPRDSKGGDLSTLRALDEIGEAAARSVDEVRDIAYNLRPYHLDEVGLTDAINSMIDKVAAASSIHFHVEIDDLDGLLPPESEINLYRIVQEGINNIVKHSGAAAADISIHRDSRIVDIVIKDNGKGFDAGAARNGEGGFGLVGIAERVRLLGAKQSIESLAGEGTTLNIILDLRKAGHVNSNGSSSADLDRG